MFIGSFDELPGCSFGSGLPGIRSWSRRWVLLGPLCAAVQPGAYRDRAGLRRRLGYPGDEPLLVAAVGGTAVGAGLLELTCEAFARLRKQVPDAVVQGGLSTTMERVATGRPFIYFPLRRHWEQQHFVTHRLSHYRAGLRMDYATTSADDLATAMRTAVARASTGPGCRQVPRGGASRAATRIAALLAGQ